MRRPEATLRSHRRHLVHRDEDEDTDMAEGKILELRFAHGTDIAIASGFMTATGRRH